MTEASPKFDVRIAASLAPQMALADIVCAGIEATIVHAFQDGDLTFDLPVADVRWLRDGSDLRVVIPYQVDIGQQRNDAKVRTVVLRVLLRVDYRIADDAEIADDAINHFVGISAFMHSWPYLRSEVEMLTTKLRLPPLILPVMLSGHAQDLMNVRKMEEPAAFAPSLSVTVQTEPATATVQSEDEERQSA